MIIMADGFSAVKEMYLDKYAEAFANAGFRPPCPSRSRELIAGLLIKRGARPERRGGARSGRQYL